MIVTELYHGQGLGNQLWSYVVTRSIALDKGYEFGIMCPERFKGADFFNLDFGKPVFGGSGPEGGPPVSLPKGIMNYFAEKEIYYVKYACDVRDFDPRLMTIEDNTKIEGVFQSENYIKKHREEIRKWLSVKDDFDCYDFSHSNMCVLNIRGGEYKGNQNLILPKKYWLDAIGNMLKLNENLKFIIITDDVEYAKKLFPEYPSFHFNIGIDFSIIKNAHYLILSNSSFGFFPAWINTKVKYVIAPKYWSRHNISNGFWSSSYNLYENWLWQDRSGKLSTFIQCKEEYSEYKKVMKFENLIDENNSKKVNYFKYLFFKQLDYFRHLYRRL